MYSVYVNFIHDKAIVHRGACAWANNGEGIHPNASRDTDGWMTALPTRDDALLAAYMTERGSIRCCEKCNP
ncbi:MAG TPA: hypothetical protein VFA76_16670 [Terriglobales bacterium]|nr:hypothetical protein [Terriglobales bacterium]